MDMLKRLVTLFVQVAIVAVPVLLFAWLLDKELVPGGTFIVRHAVGERSPFIDRLLPDVRVEQPGTIIADPVTFFVHPHRSFDRVDAEIRFKNHGAPIVELGALANVEAQAYDLKPLQNLLIDDSTWNRTDQGGVVLLQRKKRFASIAGFLSHPPPRSEIAASHYQLARPFRIAGYAPSAVPRTTDVTLRGFHAFKTYVKNESLAFSFSYTDMNRDDGADPISIVVFDENGAAVADTRADDDGNVRSDAKSYGLRHIDISVPSLPEGVYKVELRATRDIFFRSYSTPQQKVVFLNNVFLGDEVGYQPSPRSVRFYTEGKHLTFSTTHAAGVQKVNVGSRTVSVSEPYAKVAYDVPENGVVPVLSPVGDLLVEGDGHIAFSPDQYFNPDPVSLSWNTDLDRLGVNYVIASYTSPREEDGWTVADVSFDTRTFVE